MNDIIFIGLVAAMFIIGAGYTLFCGKLQD
jgi:hypothetical protein